MSEKKELTARRMRVVDFVVESLHKIASHSSSPEALHKTADAVGESKDQTMVTILEEPNGDVRGGR